MGAGTAAAEKFRALVRRDLIAAGVQGSDRLGAADVCAQITALVVSPSPLAGEGSSAFQQKERVRGRPAPLTQSSSLKLLSCPLPQGERARPLFRRRPRAAGMGRGDVIHRRLHAAFLVWDAGEAERHFGHPEYADQPAVVDVAEMADAEIALG